MPLKIESEHPPSEPNSALSVAPGEVAEPADNAETRRCSTVKNDGEHRRAKALTGSSWCYFHDPESADERIAASRRGGEKEYSSLCRPARRTFRRPAPLMPARS